MEDFLVTVFGWVCKGAGYVMLIFVAILAVGMFWNLITGGGRKWYYYDSSRPWKGGYWAPLLPNHPPYNDYKWNPKTCRFEHKKTSEPLYPWEKTAKDARKPQPEWDWDALGLPDDKPKVTTSEPRKERPEWVSFLFDETPATLRAKRKRKKAARK